MFPGHLTGMLHVSTCPFESGKQNYASFSFFDQLLKVSSRFLSLLVGLAVTSDSKHLVILMMVAVKKPNYWCQITNCCAVAAGVSILLRTI